MKQTISRREMIRRSSLVLGTGCVCRSAGASTAPRSTCCDTPRLEPESFVIREKTIAITIEKAPSLSRIGRAAVIVNEERGLQMIIVRAGNSEFFALSRLCTHGSQVISYNHKRAVLQCNGFNHSIFDLQGQVVKGPAPDPLRSYKVRFEHGEIEVAL